MSCYRNFLYFAASLFAWTLQLEGCFDVLEDKLATTKLFLSGTTLLDCLESCPDHYFIGLQVKRCACLKNISVDGSRVYHRYRNDFYAQRTKKQTWIESFIECSATFLARSSQIPYDTPLDINGSYWLSNTRRFMTHVSVRKDPEFCMAVQVQQNGKTKQYPSPCKTRLPVLCLGTKVDNRDTTRELLVTVLVITSVLTVVVASMIIVLYMRLRKRGSNAVHVPIDSGKEVIYATVNKPRKSPTNQEQSRKRTPGQSGSDETYDHTDHHRLSQNQSPNESYYDTMQGKGIENESNYDLTHEPDREKFVVVDDSAEYSHVEDDF
ncbi:Hypothetical predicted protein [Mytilus galloprovincialis]|uniref:WSC domain-containing protein n=1 Tax=Mytilus galloprovincialis TaxID=29158 RepID=A0A8B6BR40_MYTGA|nr:Hypothetical predicted protein [Mytilus galloprovincialis]